MLSCDARNETMTFAVTDTGIGMTESQRDKLFQAFSQGDTSTSREFGGTGLGLVISSQLAEKLGGCIVVESKPGNGSTFVLSIATGPLPPEALEYSKPESIRLCEPFPLADTKLSGRVLLAEDGPDNQLYVSLILRKTGLDVVVAENGAIAVETAAKQSFDLILMDMQMPVMDGYSATRKLREAGCTVPIIALTANIMKQDVAKCLDAGCSDFLGKPFERGPFLQKLSAFLETAREDAVSRKVDGPIRCALDDEEDLEVARGFVTRLPTRLKEIEGALARKEWDALGMFAHRLRSSEMFGYPLLGQAAGDIENAVIQDDHATIESLVVALFDIADRVQRGWEPLRTGSPPRS